MKNRHNPIIIILVLFVAVTFNPVPCPCWASQTSGESQADTNTAKLMIDGKFIISLVLKDENGRLTALGSPEEASVYRPTGTSPKSIDTFIDIPAEGQAVSLTPGKYHINTIKLFEPDKNLKFYSNSPLSELVELRAGQTTILKIGAPLRHVVKTGRQGDTMRLDYSLLGAACENYRLMTDSSSSPTEAANFTIYRGNMSIRSGSFRYG